ncbi:uncharacterized protein [Nicotiana tomentosiformis]|uniref:uncharacterized protein n=1 Tax=Nicotiana tomentosiformis TaxID=4098 RepID=UPI00388CB564
MLQMWDEVEHQVWCQLKSGNSYFWFDNWTGFGALYHASGPDHWCDESIKYVDDVVENGAWNEGLLRKLLPEELADHIFDSITPPSDYSMKYKRWRKLETKGKFTMKFAWQYIRKRRDESKLYRFFWVKGVPFKIRFFMWRLWKAKLPLDDWFLRLGFVWNYFGAPAGIKIEGEQLVQVINEWWNKPGNTSLKEIYQAMPDGWIKCNTDGAFRGEFGGASYGVCIRDGIGDLIYAQADVVEEATNNIAEAQAILEAVRYIIQMQFPPCIIETDSS